MLWIMLHPVLIVCGEQIEMPLQCFKEEQHFIDKGQICNSMAEVASDVSYWNGILQEQYCQVYWQNPSSTG